MHSAVYRLCVYLPAVTSCYGVYRKSLVSLIFLCYFRDIITGLDVLAWYPLLASNTTNVRLLLCVTFGLLVHQLVKEHDMKRETKPLPWSGERFPNSGMETGIYDPTSRMETGIYETKSPVVIREEDTSAARGLTSGPFTQSDFDGIWRIGRIGNDPPNFPSSRHDQTPISRRDSM